MDEQAALEAWIMSLSQRAQQGLYGELLVADYLDAQGIPYLHVSLHRFSMSKALLKAGAKHPDFLAFLTPSTRIFLDAKAHTIAFKDPRGVFVGINADEYSRYTQLVAITGIEIGFAFVPPDTQLLGLFTLGDFMTIRPADEHYPDMRGVFLKLAEFKEKFKKR